jgi:predicted ATPase
LVIDDGLARGLTIKQIRRDEKRFQDDVLARKIDIEAGLKPGQVTFLDRGMHDSLAYYTSLGWKPTLAMQKALQAARYQTVFLLEPLPTFEQDYARTEDAAFTHKITELLHDAYSQYGMTPIRVPVLSPNERAQFILQHANLA